MGNASLTKCPQKKLTIFIPLLLNEGVYTSIQRPSLKKQDVNL